MDNNSIATNFVPFNSDGLELVVNTDTGLAYASVSATARMLETPRQTVALALENPCHNTLKINAEIPTTQGLRLAQLFPASVVFKLAIKYHPGLAEKMGEAGANLYMLKLAGYEVAIEHKVPQTYAEALLEAGRLQLEVERQAAQIEAQAPLVEYAEAVQCSDTSIEIGEFAKMIGEGRNRLFGKMRDMGIVMKSSTLPYQKFCDAGYFEVSQEITENGKLIPFALLTGKGQIWLKQRLDRSKSNQQAMINAIASGVAQMSML